MLAVSWTGVPRGRCRVQRGMLTAFVLLLFLFSSPSPGIWPLGLCHLSCSVLSPALDRALEVTCWTCALRPCRRKGLSSVPAVCLVDGQSRGALLVHRPQEPDHNRASRSGVIAWVSHLRRGQWRHPHDEDRGSCLNPRKQGLERGICVVPSSNEIRLSGVLHPGPGSFCPPAERPASLPLHSGSCAGPETAGSVGAGVGGRLSEPVEGPQHSLPAGRTCSWRRTAPCGQRPPSAWSPADGRGRALLSLWNTWSRDLGDGTPSRALASSSCPHSSSAPVQTHSGTELSCGEAGGAFQVDTGCFQSPGGMWMCVFLGG